MTAAIGRLERWWISYRSHVVPVEAVQVQECRRAFYAGAESLMTVILTMLDSGSDPTDADLAKMDELDKELKIFAVDVKEGRA